MQYTSAEPPPDSPSLRAIDPHVTRRLPNFIPIRLVALSSQETVWLLLEQFFEGWAELDALLQSSTLFAWEVRNYMDYGTQRFNVQIAHKFDMELVSLTLPSTSVYPIAHTNILLRPKSDSLPIPSGMGFRTVLARVFGVHLGTSKRYSALRARRPAFYNPRN